MITYYMAWNWHNLDNIDIRQEIVLRNRLFFKENNLCFLCAQRPCSIDSELMWHRCERTKAGDREIFNE